MKCKNCGEFSNEGTAFCSKCGTKLEQEQILCSCGNRVEPGMFFCDKCGERVAKSEYKPSENSRPESYMSILSENFNVGIVGEFKRGKSTLINALLGKPILPTDIIPTTAALTKMSYGITPFLKIEYRSGNTEEIGLDKLADYVTKFAKESKEKAKTIKEVTVYYPFDYCKNGVNIIDTPGLDDDTSIEVIPQLDAAIMVISPMAPFSQSEQEFIRTKILARDMGKVLFVVNVPDYLDEENAQRVVSVIHDNIRGEILNKAKNTYGEDSKEYKACKQEIGKLKVYGLSAQKALKAKMSGDDAMLQQSAFPIFETAFKKFLTENRGAPTLRAPLNRITGGIRV